MTERFVAYLRVSTARQGQSGLGIGAQREAVTRFLSGGDRQLVAEYVEAESGKADDRPELARALAHARMIGATLIVAKLDRLSRNARFLMSVWEGSGDGGVVFCDLPQIPAGPVGKFLVHQMAGAAELEAGLISQRTTAALAEAKRRGVRLGGYRGGRKADPGLAAQARQRAADAFAASVAPLLTEMQMRGLSLNSMARALSERGVVTPRGGGWTAQAVANVIRRLAATHDA